MWEKLKETTLDVLLPKKCVGCGREERYICEKCSLFLSEAPSIFRPGNLEELVSIWEYEGLIKDIILKIKYDGIFEAIDELVEMAFKAREPYVPEDTTITFVPMFKKKERERGFNQAELIAQKVGELLSLAKQPVEVLSLLEKIKDTPSQTELNKEERIKNVRDSFQRAEGVSCYNNVLLVDDIWTSGATMKECAKVLKRSGVEKIWGFTLARAV
ncbi:ComF family protein [Patescibacteria group bacterium]|nr:ComF family protein [Patescibacteria group bacterium]